jgi:hypothetical protein
VTVSTNLAEDHQFSNCIHKAVPHLHPAGGSPAAIFMLAPVLLLLHQDPLMLPGKQTACSMVVQTVGLARLPACLQPCAVYCSLMLY